MDKSDLCVNLFNADKSIKMSDKEVIGGLLQAMDDGKDFISGQNNYVWFYRIANVFKPKVIVEMGTRFGYSMKAFVDGAGHKPDEYTIHSFDMECDGIQTLHVFEEYFRNNLGIQDIHITRADTQSLTTLDLDGQCDLCMVDGMHTVDGCRHECYLGWAALKSGGVMIIDDTNYPLTKKGVDAFCAEIGEQYIEVSSFRGIAMLVKH